MDIMVAKHAGFCFGVKRAIEIAERVAEQNSDTTYVYGQLVHNEGVIEELEKKGIAFADTIDKIPRNATTVLRAHGEPGVTYSDLQEKSIVAGKNLNDATCPLVTLVHNVAKKLMQNGYEVILFGKKNHPEAIGTVSHLKGNATYIVQRPDEADEVTSYIQKNNFDKVALISMTTMSVRGYQQLIENINKRAAQPFEEVHLSLEHLSKPFVFVDTICNPTKQRQSDTEHVAQQADVMIVIGGKNSSNSKELAHTSRKYGVETHFVQNADQLEKEWFVKREKIGVTAGASTPDAAIQAVVDRIKTLAA